MRAGMHGFFCGAVLLSAHATIPATVSVSVKFDPGPQFTGVVAARASRFGVFPVNVPIEGRLVYLPGKSSDGCTEIDSAHINAWPFNEPVIMLIDRGGCPFVTKVA